MPCHTPHSRVHMNIMKDVITCEVPEEWKTGWGYDTLGIRKKGSPVPSASASNGCTPLYTLREKEDGNGE